jgi:hypothetical protein
MIVSHVNYLIQALVLQICQHIYELIIWLNKSDNLLPSSEGYEQPNVTYQIQSNLSHQIASLLPENNKIKLLSTNKWIELLLVY